MTVLRYRIVRWSLFSRIWNDIDISKFVLVKSREDPRADEEEGRIVVQIEGDVLTLNRGGNLRISRLEGAMLILAAYPTGEKGGAEAMNTKVALLMPSGKVATILGGRGGGL